jgi:hypothetical protein
MEAVWRRIILIVVAAVLLTMILFPIVRGSSTNEEGNETISTLISTHVGILYFGPKDRNDPPDGRPDLYEDHPEDWIFSYQVLEYHPGNNSNIPVPFAPVWLNITMGPYKNSTRAVTDPMGKVFFNFTSRFTDTETGLIFIPGHPYYSFQNISFELNFEGENGYAPSKRTKFCTYYRSIHGDYGCGPPTALIFILMNLIIFTSIDIFAIIYVPYREIKRFRNRKKKFKIKDP